MTRYSATLALLLGLTVVNAQSFKVDTLLTHEVPSERINVVILGDGYLQDQLGYFLADARTVVDDLFDTSPFKQYKNYFNVYAISVPSNAEGAANDPLQLIDNYYGSTFNYAGIQRLLMPTKFDKVYEVLAKNLPTYDQVLMIVNTETYGGSGGAFATFSLHPAASDIAMHELGHSFGGLADEYAANDAYYQEVANATEESSPRLVKWKNWLKTFGVGIFRHGNSTWYKPHTNCKMENLDGQFCPVCREQFVRKIQEYSSVVGPHDTQVGPESISFNLALIEPEPNTLKVKWLLNNVEFAKNVATTEVMLADLANGTNTVDAIIYDSTSLDRRNTVNFTTITWTLQADISFWLRTTTGDRPGLIITDVEDEISMTRLSVFPNPVSNLLVVEYDLPYPTQTELSIRDVQGKKVFNMVKADPGQTNSQEIDISGYSNGMYVLEFKSGNFSQSLRILKAD